MKIKYTLAAVTLLLASLVFGQVTFESNAPAGNRYLGFDNSSGIDLPLENNGVRTVYSFEDWPGYNNIGGQLNSSRIHFPTDPLEIQTDIFSIVQIGDIINPAFQRDWMQVGTTYGAGGDLMYTGIIQDPANAGNQTGGDAVIAWGDNQNGGTGQGPDNFRLLFISNLTSATTGPNSDQGRETMRITPQGNVGIGDSFSNALQPSRRLVVHRQSNAPQFRIARTLDEDPTLGRNADFQVAASGVLHIKAIADTADRAVAVGFLQGEQTNPTGFTTLDVGGITRIRELPDDTARTCLIIGTIADTAATANEEDHYLSRIDFLGATDSVLSSAGTWVPLTGEDCRWVDAASVTVIDEKDIYTGFNNDNEDCDRGKVGIGVNLVRRAKLEVENKITRDSVFAAVYGGTDMEQQGDGQPNFYYGVFGETQNALEGNTASVCGVKGYAKDSRYQVGVLGESNSTLSTTGSSIGVAGLATTAAGANPYGVYGEVIGVTTGNKGGYFVGGITSTASTLIISDENVKTNIDNLIGASDVLMQLAPKTYEFVSPDNREIAFDQGIRFGFLAQELQEVLPQLVAETTVPERVDSTGFVEGTSVDLLGIKYTELIPILVAGFQEQNALMVDQAAMITEQGEENEALIAELDELKSDMAEMQSQMTAVMSSVQSTQSKMNNCCGTTPTEKGNSETGGIELEQNFPNPFDEVTTINFTINEPAQIRLEISDSQGRVLELLVNQTMTEGRYTERWDASAFAPGTYYYSLYADTELLTKKMIKR